MFPERAPGLIDVRRAHARGSISGVSLSALWTPLAPRARPCGSPRRCHPAAAALVDLSAHTIKDRLEKIAAAFDVRSRAEIVAEAFRAGLISRPRHRERPPFGGRRSRRFTAAPPPRAGGYARERPPKIPPRACRRRSRGAVLPCNKAAVRRAPDRRKGSSDVRDRRRCGRQGCRATSDRASQAPRIPRVRLVRARRPHYPRDRVEIVIGSDGSADVLIPLRIARRGYRVVLETQRQVA